MSSLKHQFRQIKKLPGWIYWFPARLLQVLFHTLYRLEIRDPHGICHDPQRFIGVAWHNRLLFFPVAFPKEIRQRTKAVVSSSRDGQYVADFIAQLGLESLRGSSSKRGALAQLAAIGKIRENLCIAFTPDGPRGPRYVMKSGPIHLASVTGGRIVPVSLNASRCWSVRSWDGFQIPKPGAKITLILGEPISIPPDLDADGIERYRRIVEQALLDITIDPLD